MFTVMATSYIHLIFAKFKYIGIVKLAQFAFWCPFGNVVGYKWYL